MAKSFDLLKDKERKLYFKYLGPGIFGMMMLAGYVFVDALCVGRALGGAGLAALNVSTPIVSLMYATGFLFATGSTMPYFWIQPCLRLVPWVRYSNSSILILNTWRSGALSGELDFPWKYLYEEKLDQKVIAGEIQQWQRLYTCMNKIKDKRNEVEEKTTKRIVAEWNNHECEHNITIKEKKEHK